jgi:hypothetical protein
MAMASLEPGNYNYVVVLVSDGSVGGGHMQFVLEREAQFRKV